MVNDERAPRAVSKETTMMNACYKCKYRGAVPGSTHSQCLHPLVKENTDAMGELMALLGSVGRVGPTLGKVAKDLGIRGDAHGFRSGWFNWPYNFDPVWLINCDGFVETENPPPKAAKPEAEEA